MTKQEFKELVAKGKVVLDGATGSNLMKAGMPRGVCSEAWIYENPQALIELQKAYAEADIFCKQNQSGKSWIRG